MKITLIVLVLILAVVAATAWVRLAPSDPDRWHVDPTAASDPGAGGALIAPGDPGNPWRDVTPDALMTAAEDAILQEPRVTRLAGAPDAGRATYVARSRLMRFPDYITVQAVTGAEGTGLWIYSRLRFGGSDTGVNAARSQRVLERVEATLGSGGQ